MASAVNHVKRSHRSEYKKRPFNPGVRRAAISPTLPKNSVREYIRGIRLIFRGKRETRQDIGSIGGE